MFNLFKKSNKNKVISAPVSGIIEKLENVNDPVFSSKAMGDGIAINFNGDDVYSPVDGEISALFPTGHAVGITFDGIEMIIHVGIDTVALNGSGFKPLIKQGDKVKQGQKIIEVKSQFIKDNGYETTTMVVFPEINNSNLKLLHEPGTEVNAKDTICELE